MLSTTRSWYNDRRDYAPRYLRLVTGAQTSTCCSAHSLEHHRSQSEGKQTSESGKQVEREAELRAARTAAQRSGAGMELAPLTVSDLPIAICQRSSARRAPLNIALYEMVVSVGKHTLITGLIAIASVSRLAIARGLTCSQIYV
jgi:hypothetical protein